MSLTPRPKTTVQHRKRSALHHRRSKSYMHTYWPYMPMLAIVGLGLAVNSVLDKSSLFSASATGMQAASAAIGSSNVLPLTRAQVLVGSGSSWIPVTIVGLGIIAGVWLAFSHIRRFRLAFEQSEQFIIKHPMLDIALVFVVTSSAVLGRVVT